MVARTNSSHDVRTRVEAPPPLRATYLWLFDTAFDLDLEAADGDARALLLASVAVDGVLVPGAPSTSSPAGLGAAIEHALLGLAVRLGVTCDPVTRPTARRAPFLVAAPPWRLTSIDDGRHGVTVTMKGAIEAVLPCCTRYLDDQGRAVPLIPDARRRLRRAAAGYRARGCTVLAVAHRAVGVGYPAPGDRGEAERELVLIGLVALREHPVAASSRVGALTAASPVG